MSTVSATGTGAVALSGLSSGVDYTSIVNMMVAADSVPITNLQTQQGTLNKENTAYSNIAIELNILSGDAQSLSPSLFSSRVATIGDSSVVSASVASGTNTGQYIFKISQLATAASQLGATGVGGKLNTSAAISSAGFATPVTAGSFTVNGKTINVTTDETVDAVLTDISNQTGLTATYSAGTDKITLQDPNSGTTPIVLGSASDTSNFLAAAHLYNDNYAGSGTNGGTNTGTITSTSGIGGINLNATMANANFSAAITNGGAGSFTINGATVSYSNTETVSTILAAINNSSAGVTAGYDSIKNQFTLTNTATGATGITLQDVTGNFLAATGLTGGTLQAGKNLVYSVNGGGAIVSQSNTITGTSSGVNGLTVTALGTGTTTVNVSADTASIGSAITSFVTEYNKVQALISNYTTTSTDSSGNITPGLLTYDQDINKVVTKLRTLTYSAANAYSSNGISGLAQLGFKTNGTDQTIAQSSSAALTSALQNNLQDVSNIFNSSDGIATQIKTFVNDVTGPTGTLTTNQDTYTQQVQDISLQINQLQDQVAQEKDRLLSEFYNMEQISAQMNSWSSFLTAQLNSTNTNTLNNNLTGSSTSSGHVGTTG